MNEKSFSVWRFALTMLVGVAVLALVITAPVWMRHQCPKSQVAQLPPDTLVPATEAEVAQPVAAPAPEPVVAPVLQIPVEVASVSEPEVQSAPEDPAQYLIPSCAIKAPWKNWKSWRDDPNKDGTGTLHPELRYAQVGYPVTYGAGCLQSGTYVHPTLGQFAVGRSSASRRLASGTYPASGGTVTIIR
jgi:hypothetical protein